MTAATILSISDIDSTTYSEPRILDLRVARALGFAQPRDIRKLIERHSAALSRLGNICATVAQNTDPLGRGRPGKEYALTRKQALFLCTKSEAENAIDVTIQMVNVFDAALSGTLPTTTVPVRAHNRRVSTSRATATRLEALVERLERCVPPDAPPLMPMSSQPRKIAGYLVDVEDHDIGTGDDVMLQSESGGYFVTKITLGGAIPCVAAGIVMVAITPPSGVRYAPCKLIGKVVRRRAA